MDAIRTGVVLRPNLVRAAVTWLPLWLVLVGSQVILYEGLPNLLSLLAMTAVFVLFVQLRRRDWVKITDSHIEGPRGWGRWSRRRITFHDLDGLRSGKGRLGSVTFWSRDGECIVLDAAFDPRARKRALEVLSRHSAT